MLTMLLALGLLAVMSVPVSSYRMQASTDSTASVLNRSEELASAGDTAAAIALLEASLDTSPDNVRLLAYTAWLYAARASSVPVDFADRKLAEEYATRAWRLNPHGPQALGALAWVRLKQQTPSAASRLLERAMASPEFTDLAPAIKADFYFLSGECAASRARDFENLVLATKLSLAAAVRIDCGEG